MAINS